jgi:hypothetical protein
MLFGKAGAKQVEFERQLRIFRGGTAPNIDVWIERDKDIVAVESKFLEYLTPTQPTFSRAYDRLGPPKSESRWWKVYEATRGGVPQLLDRAQLVKHYFGLNEYREKSLQGPNLTLLYIFWEPLNWQDVEECRAHREEVKVFAGAVSNSQIPFRWMTYSDLWKEWLHVPALESHVQRLLGRYQVRV